jgi:hypothetical protein
MFLPDKTVLEQTALEKFVYNKIFTWSGPTANQVKIFVPIIEIWFVTSLGDKWFAISACLAEN